MIPLPQMHKPPPADNCGTCTACCVIPAIPELGKPFYARCVHVCDKGCDAYEQRPGRCREYRCAWHLGALGPRVDRRPDQCGVMFQFDPGPAGEWYLGLYELVPGAAGTEKARFLRDVILGSKWVRHLRFGQPSVRVYPHGSDLPIDFASANAFPNYVPPVGDVPVKRVGNVVIYAGKTRPVLEPLRDVE